MNSQLYVYANAIYLFHCIVVNFGLQYNKNWD